MHRSLLLLATRLLALTFALIVVSRMSYVKSALITSAHHATPGNPEVSQFKCLFATGGVSHNVAHNLLGDLMVSNLFGLIYP